MFKKYAIAIVLAFGIHAVAGAALLWGWDKENPELKQFQIPDHINAKLVVLEKPKSTNKKPTKPTKPKISKAAQDKAAKDKAAKEKAAKEKAAREKAAKEKAAREKAARDKAAKEKAALDAENKRKEEERKKAAELVKKHEEEMKRKKAEEEAKAKAAAEQEAQELALAESSLLDGLDEEDDVIAQQTEQLEADELEAYTYLQLNQRYLYENWSVPASAKAGTKVVLEVHLVPSGEVVDVILIQSSGDNPTDRSAERAVFKYNKFQVPQNTRVFEKYYRKFPIEFNVDERRLL